jgi:hypothetical protein
MSDQQQPKHAFRPPTGHSRPRRRGRTSVVVVTAAVGALSASIVVGASATPRTSATVSAATHRVLNQRGLQAETTRSGASATSATATSGSTGKSTSSAGQAASSSAASNSGRIYFGVDGTVSSAANGMSLARHIYGQVNGNVPNARMVTMGTSGQSYAAIAGAKPGSGTYNNIVRWANTIKARGTLTLFGFDHEPESKYQSHQGSAAQYIAAYRHVADIIRSQGVSNVRFVWQMTAYSFRTKGSQAASRYYPGDNYVDDVGADPYNWGSCRGPGPWVQLSTVTDPVLTFARAHGKTVVLAEFASTGGSQRAAWLNSAHQYLVANRSTIQGAFYFDRKATSAEGARCNWSLTSSADVSAFRAIVNDTHYFSS